MRLVLFPALAVVALLAGCTAAPDSTSGIETPGSSVVAEPTATPTQTPTPTSTGLAESPAPTTVPTAAPQVTATPKATTLKSIIAAVKKAGFACKTFDRDDAVEGSTASGFCRGSEIGIFKFKNKAGVDAVLKLNEDSVESGIFLVGPTWLVTSSQPADLVKLRKSLGGELWPTNSPIFD